jgi:hypothetical protein
MHRLAGPWLHDSWPASIAIFKDVQLLIITTPRYIFWPPSEMHERRIRMKWTGGLCPPHALTSIAFYAGQIDEGAAIDKFEEENGKHYGHGKIGYGQNVFWTFHGDSWDLGSEPHFGDESHEYFGTFFEVGHAWLLDQPMEESTAIRDRM